MTFNHIDQRNGMYLIAMMIIGLIGHHYDIPSSCSRRLLFLEHLYRVTRNMTDTILILLACYCFIIRILLYSLSTSAPPLLLGFRVFHTPYPGSTFKSPGECDGSDLVLCTADCGLRAVVFLHVFQ